MIHNLRCYIWDRAGFQLPWHSDHCLSRASYCRDPIGLWVLLMTCRNLPGNKRQRCPFHCSFAKLLRTVCTRTYCTSRHTWNALPFGPARWVPVHVCHMPMCQWRDSCGRQCLPKKPWVIYCMLASSVSLPRQRRLKEIFKRFGPKECFACSSARHRRDDVGLSKPPRKTQQQIQDFLGRTCSILYNEGPERARFALLLPGDVLSRLWSNMQIKLQLVEKRHVNHVVEIISGTQTDTFFHSGDTLAAGFLILEFRQIFYKKWSWAKADIAQPMIEILIRLLRNC